MSSNITGGLGAAVPMLPQPPFNKKENTFSPSESSVQVAPMTTIPQIHQDQEKTIQELKKAIDAIQGPQKSLEISVHKKTNAIMIKVMNKETGDTIREIPSEKILDVVAKMMEYTGILVDKKV
ncbi:flagellar protein FlaG [Saccharibacillus sp. JS10]|uniref:flagellar protein FlaG n=1 Tax=Saccharibacillus sp. JS10 TaxID=2950552 RepID=UPI00210B891C|nr:flagellar protein FlaG [Saccharibacillus sp. JS10]MCQ4088818.1 flagellar protein FlaG [Saccharibacillus sp. JS10]